MAKTRSNAPGKGSGGGTAPARGKAGWQSAARLVGSRIRDAGASRGFAASRLLTHWAEVAGAELAEHTRPVNVSYGRGGLGATLTILTTGARAPMVEMQAEALRTRVNAVYGYNAIARIRITQTAPTGFAEGQASFAPAPPETAPAPAPDDPRARALAEPLGDDDLRAAIEQLGRNVLSRGN